MATIDRLAVVVDWVLDNRIFCRVLVNLTPAFTAAVVSNDSTQLYPFPIASIILPTLDLEWDRNFRVRLQVTNAQGMLQAATMESFDWAKIIVEHQVAASHHISTFATDFEDVQGSVESSHPQMVTSQVIHLTDQLRFNHRVLDEIVQIDLTNFNLQSLSEAVQNFEIHFRTELLVFWRLSLEIGVDLQLVSISVFEICTSRFSQLTILTLQEDDIENLVGRVLARTEQ